jgi:drug/metabolite transporter (DMT)-like permease
LIATIPVMNAVAAHFMLHDRLPGAGWAGFLVSFAGVVLTVCGDPQKEGAFGLDPRAFIVLIAALSGTLYTVLQKRLFPKYTGLEVAAYSTWLGTLPLLFWADTLAAKLPGAEFGAIGAAVYIGVFPAAIAYALFSYALSQTAVTRVSTYYYLIPGFSFVTAWLWVGEVPTWLTAAGGATTLLGILIVERSRGKAQAAAHAEQTPSAIPSAAAQTSGGELMVENN